jgi:Cu/Ag efflux protein CusF
MNTKRAMVWLLAAALATAAASAGAAADVTRHSGSVTAVDRSAGTITLGELGPWKVVRGQTVVTPRVIAVTPETEFARVRRGAEGETSWSRDFVEERLAPWEVKPGDFVTVECRREGARMVALKVTVATVTE